MQILISSRNENYQSIQKKTLNHLKTDQLKKFSIKIYSSSIQILNKMKIIKSIIKPPDNHDLPQQRTRPILHPRQRRRINEERNGKI